MQSAFPAQKFSQCPHDLSKDSRHAAKSTIHRIPVADFKHVSSNQHCCPSFRSRTSITCRATNEPMSLAKDFAATKLFRYWIQGAVFLIVLAAVDAAYSGDWSRVGVITKETEDSLKPLIIALGAFHIGCAVFAARIASSKQLNVAPRVLKVLAVGFLALVETYLADGDDLD